MSLTIVDRTDTFEAWRTKTNTISTQVGDIALLDAGITADTNLTAAVNELQGDIGVQALSGFTGAPATLRSAANEIKHSDFTFNGNKTLSGNVLVQGTLGVQGATDLQGVLGVQGATTLKGSLGVQGAATLQGTVDIQGPLSLASAALTGDLSVGGNTTLGNQTSDTVTVSGTLGVQGITSIHGSLNVTQGLTVSGSSLTFGSGVQAVIQGIQSYTDTTTIAGNLQVLGTTTITGATTFSANFNTLNNKPSPIVGVTLTGGVTGSGTATLANLATGTYTATIATVIGADQVALGTNTTGNYIATAAAGTGITVSGSGSETAAITITNSDRGSSQNIFKNIAVDGQSTVVADTNDDTLTLVAGSNIAITTNAGTDTITITSTTAPGNDGQITVATTAGLSVNVTENSVAKGSAVFGVNTANPHTINLANTDKGSSQNIFKNIAVSGQTTVAAETNTATLTLVAAQVGATSGLAIVTDNTTKTVTFSHVDTSSVANVTSTAGTAITGATFDTYGHVTAVTTTSLDSRYLQLSSGGTVAGNLTVSGDLIVSGTTTTVNSSTLNIADLNINIAKDAATAGAASGAGFTIGSYGDSPRLLYGDGSNRFVFNRSVEATSFVGPLTGAVTGNVTGNVTGSSGSCTGNAATITSQANSATISAVSANTANQIVLRDASGNFSAGTITATLTGSISGNAATVTSISGNTVSSGQITAGLGFTPYNATNPSGYTTNVGTVTSVTGSAPVVSSGGTTPAISMAAATASVNGYMTSTYASKLDGIASGATANTGTVTSVSGTGTVGGITLSGSIQGSGTLTLGGSIGNAASITGQANSATITAASTNTASQIVLRDASGNFSAGTITAALSGNATTSSSCSGNAATATVAASCSGNAATATTASSVAYANVSNKPAITISTSAASGGSSGDIWYQY